MKSEKQPRLGKSKNCDSMENGKAKNSKDWLEQSETEKKLKGQKQNSMQNSKAEQQEK